MRRLLMRKTYNVTVGGFTTLCLYLFLTFALEKMILQYWPLCGILSNSIVAFRTPPARRYVKYTR